MDILVQVLQTVALLCQAEYANAPERRQCITRYIECSCPQLICESHKMPAQLLACAHGPTNKR